MGGFKNNSLTKEVWKSLAYSGLKKVFISPWHISIIAWESMNDLTQRYAEWVHLMHTLITQLGRGLLKVLVSCLTIFLKYVPYGNTGCRVFKGDTKLEIFLPKNQHTERKLLNFEKWCSGEV